MQPLDEIETKLTFMDDLICTLNETVYRQQRQLDHLQNKFDYLAKQLKNLKEQQSESGDQPPPHY